MGTHNLQRTTPPGHPSGAPSRPHCWTRLNQSTCNRKSAGSTSAQDEEVVPTKARSRGSARAARSKLPLHYALAVRSITRIALLLSLSFCRSPSWLLGLPNSIHLSHLALTRNGYSEDGRIHWGSTQELTWSNDEGPNLAAACGYSLGSRSANGKENTATQEELLCRTCCDDFLRRLIVVPAVNILCCTLLRLVGRTAALVPRLFSREAGGAGPCRNRVAG